MRKDKIERCNVFIGKYIGTYEGINKGSTSVTNI